MQQLILASASPRRQALIQLFGLPVTIQAADVDEAVIREPDPVRMVLATARLKAAWVAARQKRPALVIGSDTTVALEGQMLGKPADHVEARRMLQALRGRVHQVHTGVVIIDSETGRSQADVATVDVPMRAYSDSEIEAYIASGDPLDKAGAYGIQHAGFRPVDNLTGCYAGVMGLPLCHLANLLGRFQVPVIPTIAADCQAQNHYSCQVFTMILNLDGDHSNEG